MIRTSPHPLIPVRRANPKLVGLLLHPISRSETWRRLMFLQVRAPRASGAKLNSWVTFTWRTCRFGGNLKRIDNPKIILDQRHFLKRGIFSTANVTVFVATTYAAIGSIFTKNLNS